MDWTTLISALAGTIVGGLITVIGQHLAARQRESATIRSEGRATQLAAIERNRTRIVELHERVSNDMAELNARVSESNELVNQERAELLGELVRDLSERHARAGAPIALIEDGALREAVDNYYTTFGFFLVAEEQRMMQEFVQHHVSVEDVWSSRDKSTDAVRAHLRSLGEEELKIFASTAEVKAR